MYLLVGVVSWELEEGVERIVAGLEGLSTIVVVSVVCAGGLEEQLSKPFSQRLQDVNRPSSLGGGAGWSVIVGRIVVNMVESKICLIARVGDDEKMRGKGKRSRIPEHGLPLYRRRRCMSCIHRRTVVKAERCLAKSAIPRWDGANDGDSRT